jgi:hypothetical protein
MGELAFFDKFGGAASRVCSGYSSLKSDDVGRLVLELHQRHGDEIWRVLNTAIGGHSAALISRTLPATSVLILTVAPGQALSPETVGRRKGALAESLEAVEDPPADEPTSRLARSDCTAKVGPDLAKGRKRGRPPVKLETTKQAMRDDLDSGRLTAESLLAMKEASLANDYSVSRYTAREARNAVLSEFVGK